MTDKPFTFSFYPWDRKAYRRLQGIKRRMRTKIYVLAYGVTEGHIVVSRSGRKRWVPYAPKTRPLLHKGGKP